LRIGVVLGDRLVEERIFTGATPVTIGQSIRCALSIPVDGVPRDHVLCKRDDGSYLLELLAGMEARLGRPGGAIEVVTGPAVRRLERGARGKLTIGEATILLQEIARPPVAPKPQLPASVRGTLADRIDRRLATIIAGSLLVHVALAIVAWQQDVETKLLGEPPTVAKYGVDTYDVPDTVDLTPPTTQPGIASPIAPAQTPHPIVHPARIITAPTTRAPSNADAARLAAILAGADEGPHGPAGMSHRQPGADLDQQIAEVRGHRITIGDGDHTSRVDERAHVGTGSDRIAIDDPTLTRTAEHRESAPAVRLRLTPEPRGDDPLPAADAVLLKITTVYMPGLQRCYQKALVGNPGLSGKIALEFTIDERGHVIDASASGMSDGMSTCVESLMAHWRFAIPKDKSGDPTDASFKLALACALGQ
jgi:hypothetical protein